LDPYDIIDDGEDVDEATLAKYGLASSLSTAVATGLDELVHSVRAPLLLLLCHCGIAAHAGGLLLL
jgi:hypothetical protein